MMKIANIELTSDAVLAPIAGFTDVGFRNICARYGAGLTYTEMISCKGMVYGSEKTRELLSTTPVETVRAVQIFGAETDIIARAVAMPEMAKFDIIDINMGCPVPKIVKNGEGSALLKSPKLASEIVRAVISASGKTVTVKYRKGFEKDDNIAVDFAKYMQDAGASAVTVHGRTREQFYQGKADWDCIARVVESVDIPVLANGDVYDLDSYIAIKEHTQADGVMIARGALARPQIFAEIAQYNGVTAEFTSQNIARDIMEQIAMLEPIFCERYIYSNMKKLICYYVKGTRDSKRIKDEVCRVESLDELRRVVKANF